MFYIGEIEVSSFQSNRRYVWLLQNFKAAIGAKKSYEKLFILSLISHAQNMLHF